MVSISPMLLRVCPSFISSDMDSLLEHARGGEAFTETMKQSILSPLAFVVLLPAAGYPAYIGGGVAFALTIICAAEMTPSAAWVP
jgi:hypothetical protein